MNTTKLNKEIQRLTKIKNGRIVKALEARADLVVAEGPQGRRLVCVSLFNGREYVTHGTLYTLPAGEDEKAAQVLRMEDYDTPHVYGRYDSVEALAKYLNERNIPHVIKFFDPDEDDE